MAGINTSTFYTHRVQDKIFAYKLAEIERGLTQEVYALNATEAKNPKNFLDRAMYLRAHMPELYNPAKVIKIEGVKLSQDDARRRLVALDGAIDAQIVNEYTTRQEREQLKLGRMRESEGKAEGGGSGDGQV